MGSDHRRDEEAIFYSALELTSPTARAAYVKEACGNDSDLLERVRALLTVDGMEDGFLVDPPTILDMPTPSQALTEAPGTVIGRYKLLEKIGEGGMAVVYMAEQEEPIRRKVALKIIKLGMDTRQVIARFEAERQALALMDHPSIAKVFDAGATETGRPYFVMELVQGVSITEYCDKNNLSTKDRLALFLQVCHAVQHAHQKGVIHRDLKPSNVMVTNHDGKPVPKVIDFGIAKATYQKLTEKTLFTRYAHIIGTPAYMSPEQAELSDMDVDTRSDIYVTRRPAQTEPWGERVNLGPVVNSPYDDVTPCLSPDGLLLLFADSLGEGSPPRPGGYGGCDIWMTRRATSSSPWQMPVNLGRRVNSAMHEHWPRISPDGSKLYFVTARSVDFNTWDNWQTPILPVVDFNADGKVDLVDLVMLIDNWGTNKTFCDIGPMPWGDGKVDIEDLKVFMTYYEKENPPAKP